MNKLKGGFEKQIVEQLNGHQDVKWFYEEMTMDYYEVKKYIPDFVIETKNSSFVLEAKGWLRPEDRRKMKLVKKQFPDVDIRFLFQNANNKLNKDSQTTYAMWAEKNGFKWAHKTIPDEWLRG